jgi:hypothetical protein
MTDKDTGIMVPPARSTPCFLSCRRRPRVDWLETRQRLPLTQEDESS